VPVCPQEFQVDFETLMPSLAVYLNLQDLVLLGYDAASLGNISRRLEETQCLYLQGPDLQILEDKSLYFFRNFGNSLPNDEASYPTVVNRTAVGTWKLVIDAVFQEKNDTDTKRALDFALQ
jgi:hypothetical protein